MKKPARPDTTVHSPIVHKVDHRVQAATALQAFANLTEQKPVNSRESAANFFVGLIQLSEQDGFVIEDAIRTARIRIHSARKAPEA